MNFTLFSAKSYTRVVSFSRHLKKEMDLQYLRKKINIDILVAFELLNFFGVVLKSYIIIILSIVETTWVHQSDLSFFIAFKAERFYLSSSDVMFCDHSISIWYVYQVCKPLPVWNIFIRVLSNFVQPCKDYIFLNEFDTI